MFSGRKKIEERQKCADDRQKTGRRKLEVPSPVPPLIDNSGPPVILLPQGPQLMQARHTRGGFINVCVGLVHSHPTTTVNTTATLLISRAVSVVALAMTAAQIFRFTSFLFALVTENHSTH
jgi:hypothetical protein